MGTDEKGQGDSYIHRRKAPLLVPTHDIGVFILKTVFTFSPVALRPGVTISAFLSSLQTVLWDTRLPKPSPRVIWPCFFFNASIKLYL